MPWIKAAKAVVHAGCTLGLEAELAGVPSIDITSIYGDNRKESVSSSVSTYKPRSISELNSCLKSSLKQKNISHLSLTSTRFKDILLENIETLNNHIFDWFDSEAIGFPKISNLSVISMDYNRFFRHTPDKPYYSPNFLASMINNSPPLPGKSRYYSAKDIHNRLKSAFKSLNIQKQISIAKLSVNNVFLLTPTSNYKK